MQRVQAISRLRTCCTMLMNRCTRQRTRARIRSASHEEGREKRKADKLGLLRSLVKRHCPASLNGKRDVDANLRSAGDAPDLLPDLIALSSAINDSDSELTPPHPMGSGVWQRDVDDRVLRSACGP